MFHTINTRLVGVFLSLTISLLIACAFLGYILFIRPSAINLDSVPSSSPSLSSLTSLSPPDKLTIDVASTINWDQCPVCPAKTYKDYLCDVKFVMLVNVSRLEAANDSSDIYSISIKKTFKKSLLFIIAFRTSKITVTAPVGCPRQRLRSSHLYLITGRVKGLSALVDHCDLVIEWDTVDESQREEMRQYFGSVAGACNP